MFEQFLLVLLFSGIALYQVPALIRKKRWRELISSSIILVIGFALCLFQVIGIKLPNPSRIIASIFHIKY